MIQSRLPTGLLAVDPRKPEKYSMQKACAILLAGGLVAFPTETVYGLGANALDERAVARIFAAKGRPADNPLIVHFAAAARLNPFFKRLPPMAWLLAERFWPGPLTLVLKNDYGFSAAVTGGLGTVAVRVPAHPVALALLGALGVPVAAPSANVSGRPSPTTAAHVLDDLEGRIDLVLDGGPAWLGVESTVLDLTGERPVLLRPGGVTLQQLEAVVGPVSLDPAVNDPAWAESENEGESESKQPRSPGMKYTHYAPKARVLLFDGADSAGVAAKILAEAAALTGAGQRVGILACRDHESSYREQGYDVIAAGWREDPAPLAASLYEALRCFDRIPVDVILAEGVPARGLGLAVMNRLFKAAGGNVVKV
ncbi:MAG: L-threonylcarbamoyladenylate synthase [Firmicutes bacterium]|nr:L-threonylcarbamoyladenylate synthase [Bacillota bacterium]